MSEGQIQTTEKPMAAFVLSLLAGLWMFGAGGMIGGFGRGGMMGGQGGQYEMAHRHGMGDWMWGRGIHAFGMSSPWFGLVAGMAVLIGAVMLYVKPEQLRSWGLVILVISALNIFVGIGGLLAGALGVVGGVLAMSAKI